MEDTLKNPIDVFETLARQEQWLYKREELEICSRAYLQEGDKKSAFSQVQWSASNRVILSAVAWPYENEAVEDLQMHRATAQINANFWEGVTFWDERTRSAVIKVAKKIDANTLELEAARQLHLLPLHALQQVVGTLNSYAYGSTTHTELLLQTTPAGRA